MATAYTPRAALRSRAACATLLAAGLAGAAGGAAAHLLARLVYLAFLVPVAWGIVVGVAVSGAARRFRLARPGFASLAAVAGVIVAAASQLALDYRIDRHERALAAAQVYELSAMGAGPTDLIDESYRQKLRELTLGRYLERRYGMDPELDPAGGLASSLGAHGMIFVGMVELAVGAAIAGALARRQALEPACPACGAWRVESRIGVAAHGVADRVIDKLCAGDAAGAAALLAPPDTRELVAFSRLACPLGHDGRAGILRVEDHEIDRYRRPRVHTCANLEVSDEELSAIAAALEEARA